MKKSAIFTPVILASALALSGCGYSVLDAAEDISGMSKSDFDDDNSKAVSSSPTQLAKFEKLGLRGPDNIVFTTGDEFTIMAEGDADEIEDVRYKLNDGKLIVGRRDGKISFRTGKSSVLIKVTAPALRSASIAGSGDMQVDEMKADSVKVTVAGSGNMDVAAIESESVKISVAGSGEMKLAGAAKTGKVSVAGSGDVKATALNIDKAKISVAGSGDVDISSDGEVNASAVGSGDINVKGTARCKSSSIGAGDINCGA